MTINGNPFYDTLMCSLQPIQTFKDRTLHVVSWIGSFCTWLHLKWTPWSEDCSPWMSRWKHGWAGFYLFILCSENCIKEIPTCFPFWVGPILWNPFPRHLRWGCHLSCAPGSLDGSWWWWGLPGPGIFCWGGSYCSASQSSGIHSICLWQGFRKVFKKEIQTKPNGLK